jgi:hypothetical protein
LTPPIEVRRGGLWAKHMGLKRCTIGNTLGGTHWEPKEHIENLMGTHWELARGTCWEQRKKLGVGMSQILPRLSSTNKHHGWASSRECHTHI